MKIQEVANSRDGWNSTTSVWKKLWTILFNSLTLLTIKIVNQSWEYEPIYFKLLTTREHIFTPQEVVCKRYNHKNWFYNFSFKKKKNSEI